MTIIAEHACYFAEIQQELVESSIELFDAYGMQTEYRPGGLADIQGPGVMAIIGYAEQTVRGAILLLTSNAVVTALAPPELRTSGPLGEEAVRDVLGEFTNMLVGRTKNRLARRGVVPLLATPTTVFGDDLTLPATRSGLSAWHTFIGRAGPIFVRFDATFEESFRLTHPSEPEARLREGEMVLF